MTTYVVVQYWDNKPESLTNEDVYKSSVVIMGGTCVISLGLALVTFN